MVRTSEPLEAVLEITEHPFEVPQAASGCPDTDWHVGLCDADPDGCGEDLSSGRMRTAHRDGLGATPSPIEPEKVYGCRT